MAAGKFTRFSEKRDVVVSDITTYDDAVDGIEPDESSGLHIPLPENNIGFKLIKKMGWKSGHGLGRTHQGRIDPVPLKLKDDHMGLGRYEHEIDLAVEATEKRKQMEIEKEITPGLIDKYKNQMDKERTIAESTSDLRHSYHCDLCDKQYTKYSEYDNHLNSYDHHHRQRLKDLKEYEVGRKFGSNKATYDSKKMAAAQMVALERAEMKAQRQSSSSGEPGFKPMGYKHSKNINKETPSVDTMSPSDSTSNAAILAALRKRSNEEIVESERKIAEKKARLDKYGVKFQSAGHLATINDELSSYQMMVLTGSGQDTVKKQETKNDSRSNSTAAMLYQGRFVSSSEGQSSNKQSNDEHEIERNKRLSTLPLAKGRKAEKLTAIEQATASDSKEGVLNRDEDDNDEGDDDGFTFGRHKLLPVGKPKKLPVKQMSLKLSDKYESYYH